MREGCKEFVIFLAGAERDTDGFGETHPGERADDDTFVEEFVVQVGSARPDVDENEIGLAGHWAQTELSQLGCNAGALGGVGFDRTLDVLGVVQSG